jgi:hypothetical protein
MCVTFEYPDRKVLIYISAFGICSVYVAANPSGSVWQTGIAQNLRQVELDNGFDMTAAFWFASRPTAVRVRNAIESVHDMIGDAEGACQIAREYSGHLRFGMSDHGKVMKRATTCLERVEAEIARARQYGALREFNRTYAEKRKRLLAEGKRAPDYNEALIASFISGVAQRLAGTVETRF